MDKRKRMPKSLIIINVALGIIVIILICMWFLRDSLHISSTTLGSLGSFFLFTAVGFTIANFFVFCCICYINEKQKEEEELKKQIAERELQKKLQMEREVQIQRERKLKMLKNYETAGRYEEAARLCDELEMWEKAGELRRKAKTSYLISTNFSMGKDGAISCTCPNCGSSQAVESKSNMVKCRHCGNNYIIPKKVLDMM